jgi:hypothetical protein
MNDFAILVPKAPRGLASIPTEIHLEIFHELLRKTKSDYITEFKLDPCLYRSNNLAKNVRTAVANYLAAVPAAATIWLLNEQRILRRLATESAAIVTTLLWMQ